MASQIGGELRRVEGSGLELVPEPPPRVEACQNPMLIDVILANMFDFLRFTDLSQCRRVSKQWYKVSLPGWLSKGPALGLSLDPNFKPEPEKYYVTTGVTGLDMSMNAFLRRVHNEFHRYGPYEFCGLRQYRNFLVSGDAGDEQQHYYLQQFLRTCGPCITELELDVEIPYDVDTYRALMLSTMTPNLAKLKASIKLERGIVFLQREAFEIMDDEEEDHSKLTHLQIQCDDSGLNQRNDLIWLGVYGWSQLLKRYPNLKTLFLGEPLNCRLLLAVAHAFRDAQLGLESLYIPLPPEERSTRPLYDFLNLLAGTLKNDTTTTRPLYELLNSQAGTLKKLAIKRLSPLDNFKPPEMPNLLSLELQGMPIPNLDSLALSFQSLQSLSITNFSSEESSDDDADDGDDEASPKDKLPQLLRNTRDGLVLPSLAKLHYDYNHIETIVNPLDPEDVSKLAKLFPNLTHLQLWLNNDTLGPVLQNWPGLQHLTIVGNGVDDEGIAGVVSDLPRMQDLKSLRMCHYDSDYSKGQGPTALTEKSLPKFLLLPNLERLEVMLNDELEPDHDIMRNLEQRFGEKLVLHFASKLMVEEEEEEGEQDDEDSDGSSSSSSSVSDNEIDDSDNDDNSDNGMRD